MSLVYKVYCHTLLSELFFIETPKRLRDATNNKSDSIK